MDDFSQLIKAAKELQTGRSHIIPLELKFRAQLNRYLERRKANAVASALRVSAQHLCDIRKGRRAATDRVLDRVRDLGVL